MGHRARRSHPAKAGLSFLVWVALQVATPYGQEVLPVRDDLRPVPMPDLDSIEAPVAEQLRAAFSRWGRPRCLRVV